MAKIAVWNWKKEQVGEVDLPAGVFDYPYRKHLVWEVVKAYLAGQRAGTHKTKVRSEVSGSGKKPFKQKGTGRARQGGGRPPIHRHGGTAHGPVPRSYAQDVSVGEKKNALKAVLSRRLRRGADRRARPDGASSAQDEGPQGRRRRARHRGQGAVRGLARATRTSCAPPATCGTGSSSTRSASTPTTCWPTARSCSRRQRAVARRQEPGRRVMLPQELIRRPLDHREGDAAEGGVQHGLLRGRAHGQQDRGRAAPSRSSSASRSLDVRVANRQGKWKRMGRFIGQRKAWKKAYVRLAPDEKHRVLRGRVMACQEIQTDLRRACGSRRCSTSRSSLRCARRRA